jgi:phage terminase small subunit
MAKDLTDKQKRFVEEYLKDLNGTQAAIRAGFSKKSADKIAYQLLEKTRVKEEIARGQAKISKKNELTHEWVIEQLKKVYTRCMQEEAVNDRDGNFTGVFEFEASGANRSLELIGKHLGTFAERIKLGGDPQGTPLETATKVTVETIDERIAKALAKS